MDYKKPKIVFLLASISQPRCLKRIRSFIEAGFNVEIYGFDRGVYNVNSRIQGYEIINLGFAPSGSNYFRKFLFASKKIAEIFKQERELGVFYYSFSFDISLICWLNRRQYIYEISDLVYGYFGSSLVRRFFTWIDRRLISQSYLTVMTSQGFFDFLFPVESKGRIIIQPNRIDSYFSGLERPISKVNSDNIVFSYIGAFRYPNTVFRFAEIIGQKYPQHKFAFFGDSTLTNQVKRLADIYENVEYHGQFRNPEDLHSIYKKVDIVVACYDVQTLNERIAEPNKLYEALFFNKPIVVSKNTFLENQVVNRFKCGYSIDASNNDNIIDFIDSLSDIYIHEAMLNISKIDLSDIIDDKSSRIIDVVKGSY